MLFLVPRLFLSRKEPEKVKYWYGMSSAGTTILGMEIEYSVPFSKDRSNHTEFC